MTAAGGRCCKGAAPVRRWPVYGQARSRTRGLPPTRPPAASPLLSAARTPVSTPRTAPARSLVFGGGTQGPLHCVGLGGLWLVVGFPRLTGHVLAAVEEAYRVGKGRCAAVHARSRACSPTDVFTNHCAVCTRTAVRTRSRACSRTVVFTNHCASRSKWDDISKVLKEKNRQPRIP